MAAYDPNDPNQGSQDGGGGDPFFQQYGGGTGDWQGQPDAKGQTGQPPVVAGPASPAAPGAPASPSGPYGGDPTNVDTWLQWMAQQPGHDPILDTPQGQQYYKTQILSKPDKLNASNLDYWKNKATLAQYGGAVGANGGNYGGGQIPLGMTGSLAQGWNGSFTDPSAADAANTPGYQFTLQQGIEGLDASAASRGTVLGGGHAKAVLDYATGLADQTYGNTWNRAHQDYQDAFNNFQTGGNNLFDRYYKIGQLGTDSAVKATS